MDETITSMEHLLGLALDQLPDLIFAKDLQHRFTYVNAALAKFVDQPREAMLGHTDFDFFPPPDAEFYHRDEDKIFATGQKLVAHVEHVQARDGVYHWYSTTKLPVHAADGAVVGLIGIGRDITSLKTTEALLHANVEELNQKNTAIEAELRFARSIQNAFLPPKKEGAFVTLTGQERLRYAYQYLPHSLIGGDMIEIFELGHDRIGVFICDVMGHDVRAALVMSFLHGLLTQISHQYSSPGRVLTHLNRSLWQIQESTQQPIFASAVYLVIDIAHGTLRYACAGHPSPLLLDRASGRIKPIMPRLSAHEPALGLLGTFRYHSRRRPFTREHALFLFTDGLFESENSKLEQYGTRRLRRNLARHRKSSLHQIIHAILLDLLAWCGEQTIDDDLCFAGLELP
jgi:sigma-B regulation protein RsbU (phosphoserine phosphatase)